MLAVETDVYPFGDWWFCEFQLSGFGLTTAY